MGTNKNFNSKRMSSDKLSTLERRFQTDTKKKSAYYNLLKEYLMTSLATSFSLVAFFINRFLLHYGAWKLSSISVMNFFVTLMEIHILV